MTGAHKNINDDRHTIDHQNVGSLDWKHQASTTAQAAVVPLAGVESPRGNHRQ